MSSNFTIHDISSLLLAISLFPVVSVFPGFVVGWVTDIFSFRHRTRAAQYVMAIALSNAIVPALLFLGFRFFSIQAGMSSIIFLTAVWVAIELWRLVTSRISLQITSWQQIALVVGGVWVLFCILLLVDIQIGQRLYFNAAAHDYTTRVALIEAITRTGIPPVNPGYYPGHFERITQLYYFWYMPESIVDILGKSWVDARIAMFAGIIWTGLALMATLATYIRIRNPQSGEGAWRISILGSQLFAISGLDVIPVLGLMIAVRSLSGIVPFDGRIEGWNMPIMSWLNALTWVPNHVSGMAACIVAFLAIISSLRASNIRRFINITIAGLSIGSALGSTIWVALTFGIFMVVWGMVVLFHKSQRSLFWPITISGTLGLIFAAKFLVEIFVSEGSSGGATGLPIGLYVRHFSFAGSLPSGLKEIVSLWFLPANYFMELGFFFVIALLWLQQRKRLDFSEEEAFESAEILLFVTTVLFMTFVKSTVIAFNDLGMRGWLLAQFILIVWSTDLLNATWKGEFTIKPASIRLAFNSRPIGGVLFILLIVGFLTSALEATVTRFWAPAIDLGVTGVPNELSPDTNLGQRSYDARLAYEYIRDHTPQDMIIQNNPVPYLDRPSGLYGTRQMVISDRTAYGVPNEILKEMSKSVGHIFTSPQVTDWILIDEICHSYSIQAIVLNDTDPIWSSLSQRKTKRTPLYINQHYAVFLCGIRN